jgi:hypothetical protein
VNLPGILRRCDLGQKNVRRVQHHGGLRVSGRGRGILCGCLRSLDDFYFGVCDYCCCVCLSLLKTCVPMLEPWKSESCDVLLVNEKESCDGLMVRVEVLRARTMISECSVHGLVFVVVAPVVVAPVAVARRACSLFLRKRRDFLKLMTFCRVVDQ